MAARGRQGRRSLPRPAVAVLAAVVVAGALAAPGALALFASTHSNGGNTFSADTLQPPSALAASPDSSSSISLTWSASPSTYATGYTILRSKVPGSGYAQVASIAGQASTSHLDSGLQPGTTYYYVGESYYQNWTSAPSGEASATTPGTAGAAPLGSWLTGLTHAAEAGSDRALVFVAGNEEGSGGSSQVQLLGSWLTGLTHGAEAGSDRLLVFVAGNEQGSAAQWLTSVSYGGQSLTRVNEVSVGSSVTAHVEIWVLGEAGIATASSSLFSVTWSSSPDNPMYAHAFFGGVDQASPTGAQATASTASSTPNPITTTALATSNGDLVVTGAVAGNSGSYTPQNGFVLGSDQTAGSTTTMGTASKASTGGSETPSMQHSNPNRQVIAGVVLNRRAVRLANAWTTGLTHTAGSGSNRLLVFVAGMENDGDRDLTAVSYGGQPLTPVADVVVGTGFRARCELWYLDEAGLAAASGSTFTVTWSGSASSFDPHYAAVTLVNVDQADPIGNWSSDGTTSANPIQPSSAVGVGAGDLVVVGAVAGNAGSYTPPGAYTEATDQAGSSSTMASAYRRLPADGTEQPSMQFDAAVNRQVVLAATVKVNA